MRQPRSLAGRVVLCVTLGSLLSGSIVAAVSGLLASRFARNQEDGQLRDAAGTLAFELVGKGYDPHYAARDETYELAHTGIVVAIFEGEQFLAGDPVVPFVSAGTCLDSSQLRACSAAAGLWTAVAARDRVLTRAHAEVTTTAACVALAVMVVLTMRVALRLARAAVGPLDELASAVGRLATEGSVGPELSAPTGVCEVDALRASLLAALGELRGALARSRSFAGDAAHQLRTPLTTMLGELDLAIEATAGAGRDETIRARREAARLSMLIDRLLVLANPEERIQGSLQVSLLDVIEDALEALPDAARARVDYGGVSVLLHADPALLVTAIVSALEHSLERAPGRVRVHAHATAERAILEVDDDGPSLALGDPAAPSARRDDHAEHADPGQDIWLAVIARVASLHGGRLHFPARAAGARLELSFPRVPA